MINSAEQSTAQQLIHEAKDIVQEGKDLLIKAGKPYDLSQWLTMKRYAQKYNLESTMVISNWIARGIVPAEDVIQLEEFNGLKLIKDKTYKE